MSGIRSRQTHSLRKDFDRITTLEIIGTADIKYSALGRFKTSEGIRLSRTDLESYLSPYEYSRYETAKRKLYTGYGLAGVTAACVAYVAVNNTTTYVEDNPKGAQVVVAGIIGSVCIVVGVPKIIIGRTRLNKVAKEHNRSNNQDLAFQFGGTPNGLGVTMYF